MRRQAKRRCDVRWVTGRGRRLDQQQEHGHPFGAEVKLIGMRRHDVYVQVTQAAARRRVSGERSRPPDCLRAGPAPAHCRRRCSEGRQAVTADPASPAHRPPLRMALARSLHSSTCPRPSVKITPICALSNIVAIVVAKVRATARRRCRNRSMCGTTSSIRAVRSDPQGSALYLLSTRSSVVGRPTEGSRTNSWLVLFLGFRNSLYTADRRMSSSVNRVLLWNAFRAGSRGTRGSRSSIAA